MKARTGTLGGVDLSCRWSCHGGLIIVRWRVCTKNDTHFLEQASGKRIAPPPPPRKRPLPPGGLPPKLEQTPPSPPDVTLSAAAKSVRSRRSLLLPYACPSQRCRLQSSISTVVEGVAAFLFVSSSRPLPLLFPLWGPSTWRCRQQRSAVVEPVVETNGLSRDWCRRTVVCSAAYCRNCRAPMCHSRSGARPPFKVFLSTSLLLLVVIRSST